MASMRGRWRSSRRRRQLVLEVVGRDLAAAAAGTRRG
jgi:hypothetical protein